MCKSSQARSTIGRRLTPGAYQPWSFITVSIPANSSFLPEYFTFGTAFDPSIVNSLETLQLSTGAYEGPGGNPNDRINIADVSVTPAPGPIPGAGLLSYVAVGLLGLGSIGWKRLLMLPRL
jgi:hypothetical protein